MPIKQKSSFNKREYEYTSPDGDRWIIFYIENEGRKYVQIGRDGQDPQTFETWDAAMLLDIADQIKESTLKAHKIQSGGRPSLRKPQITDHRGSPSEVIDSSVQETMRNYDDNEAPVQSFRPSGTSTDDWVGVRTGVNVNELNGQVETPEDLQRVRDTPDWIERPRLPANTKNIHRGDQGLGFKRVSAAELI